MSLACVAHQSAVGFFPTGGWFYRWAGDPNQGFTKIQPGGWCYNILPWIEQQPLHDLGKGMGLGPPPQYATDTSGANGQRMSLGAQMAATPVQVFVCPSRRKAVAFPYMDYQSWCFYNISMTTSSPIARTDYASNGGDYQSDVAGWGPDPGWGTPPNPYYEGQDIAGYNGPGPGGSYPGGISGAPNPSNPSGVETGVIYRRSMIQSGNLLHGASNTYLIGEKFLDSAFYYSNQFQGDETGWAGGFSSDDTRWTGFNCYSVTTAPDRSSNGPNYSNALMTVPRKDCTLGYKVDTATGGARTTGLPSAAPIPPPSAWPCATAPCTRCPIPSTPRSIASRGIASTRPRSISA